MQQVAAASRGAQKWCLRRSIRHHHPQACQQLTGDVLSNSSAPLIKEAQLPIFRPRSRLRRR